MNGLVLLCGPVYIRQQSVNMAVTAPGVEDICAHQLVYLCRGHKMLCESLLKERLHVDFDIEGR